MAWTINNNFIRQLPQLPKEYQERRTPRDINSKGTLLFKNLQFGTWKLAEVIDRRRTVLVYFALTLSYPELYRFEEDNIDWLAHVFLGNDFPEARGGALNQVQVMRATLRYLSDPGFMSGVGEDLGVHKSTVCRRLHQGINAIVDQKDQFIQFPMTADAFRIARQEWVDQGHHFPGAFNIIDCTHIKVLKPGPNLYGDDYINRKQFASINVQVQYPNSQFRIPFISFDPNFN